MFRRILAIVLVSLIVPLAFGPVAAQDQKAEAVDNPYYMAWKDFKEKTTATHEERTVYSGEAAKMAPAGGELKVVTYTLTKVNPDSVVVSTEVAERDFLSTIVQAKTRIIYPAKVNKADLEALLQERGAKWTDTEATVPGGKKIAAKMLTTTIKNGPEETTRKTTFSYTIPGGIIEKVSTVKNDGKLVAETTVTLKSFKVAD
jgi:hypothetical protein